MKEMVLFKTILDKRIACLVYYADCGKKTRWKRRQEVWGGQRVGESSGLYPLVEKYFGRAHSCENMEIKRQGIQFLPFRAFILVKRWQVLKTLKRKVYRLFELWKTDFSSHKRSWFSHFLLIRYAWSYHASDVSQCFLDPWNVIGSVAYEVLLKMLIRPTRFSAREGMPEHFSLWSSLKSLGKLWAISYWTH